MRVKHLDIAKGICLLLVMIAHSCGMPFGNKYFISFYIQTFFILSGITYKRGRNVRENIVRRFKNIIIPYFYYNIIIIIINIILGKLRTVESLIEAVIGCIYSRYCLYPLDYPGENKFFLQIGNSPMWFLTAMFLSSCMFYLIVEYINERIYIYIYIGLIGLTILLNHLPILLPWSIDTAFLGTFFMLIGYYWRNLYLQTTRWKVLIFALLMYIICCYSNEGINISIRMYGNYGSVSVIAVCIIGMSGSLLCTYLSKKLEFVPLIRDIFEYIGKNTIMILALHVTIFEIFDKLRVSIGISQDINCINYYGVGLMRLFVTVGVCYCIYYMKNVILRRKALRRRQ